LSAQCGGIVQVSYEGANLAHFVGGTNGLKTAASIDEEIPIGVGRMAPNKDGHSLPVLFNRRAKIVHILWIEAVRISLVLDLDRIELPDMVSIDSITRRPQGPIA
jgi:hypothetical protein